MENCRIWLHLGVIKSPKLQLDTTSMPRSYLEALPEESLCCLQTTNVSGWSLLNAIGTMIGTSFYDLMTPSNTTPEQLINGLPRPLFNTAATLCLLSMHSHSNSTYMYILPQLLRLTGVPCTLTLYRYPLYLTSLLLFYCCCEMIRYFHLYIFTEHFFPPLNLSIVG